MVVNLGDILTTSGAAMKDMRDLIGESVIGDDVVQYSGLQQKRKWCGENQTILLTSGAKYNHPYLSPSQHRMRCSVANLLKSAMRIFLYTTPILRGVGSDTSSEVGRRGNNNPPLITTATCAT